MSLTLITFVVLAIFAGLIIGTITGLAPGIHINLLATILLANLPVSEQITLPLIAFLISIAVTHIFVDFIPSIFLGAPEENTFLSILPGHKLLLEGKGKEAVVYCLFGALFGIIATIIIALPFAYVLPLVAFLPKIIPFILIFIVSYSVLRDKKILPSTLIFLLASFLGFAALNLPINEPLLPLLAGMFGASAMFLAIKEETKIPKQSSFFSIPKINEIKKPAIASIILAPIFSVFPGISSGNIAFVCSELFKSKDREFLFLTGVASSMTTALSFIVLYAINKSRTGIAVSISKLIPDFTLNNLYFILLILLISSIFSLFISLKISNIFTKRIHKISYKKISLVILIFITLIVLFMSGWRGIIVFITSTALGIYTIRSGARRIHLMGCLITPTILFYLF